MTDRPGRLWALIQEWLDAFRFKPPSQRELAPRLGVSPSTFGDYKYARTLPPPGFLVLLAEEMQMPYERVLDAALEDNGYRGESLRRVREEVMGHANGPAPMKVAARKSRGRLSRDEELEQELEQARRLAAGDEVDESSAEDEGIA